MEWVRRKDGLNGGSIRNKNKEFMPEFDWGRVVTVSGLAAAILASRTGCQQLPGRPGQQGAAIGGVGGAATGAVVGGEEHRLLGAVVGGLVGAGGGYLI